jgi:hypothetical protein
MNAYNGGNSYGAGAGAGGNHQAPAQQQQQQQQQEPPHQHGVDVGQHAGVVSCSNDLWKFDTATLEWSQFTYSDHVLQSLQSLEHAAVSATSTSASSTSKATNAVHDSWPAGECGAAAVVPSSPTLTPGGPVPNGAELLGGWRNGAFAPCGNGNGDAGAGAGAGADCGSDPWEFRSL